MEGRTRQEDGGALLVLNSSSLTTPEFVRWFALIRNVTLHTAFRIQWLRTKWSQGNHVGVGWVSLENQSCSQLFRQKNVPPLVGPPSHTDGSDSTTLSLTE